MIKYLLRRTQHIYPKIAPYLPSITEIAPSLIWSLCDFGVMLWTPSYNSGLHRPTLQQIPPQHTKE